MPFVNDGKITHIVHYPDQVVIYYEGGVAVWSRSTFEQHPMAVGAIYKEDEHRNDTSTYDALLEKAYHWLAIRDYPYVEMMHKLADTTLDSQLVAKVMQTLVERQLINDVQYAQHQLEKVIEMGYGSLHLREVLLAKGIPLQTIDDVVSRYDSVTEHQLAEKLIHEWLQVSTLRQKAPAPFASSLMNRLKIRGFQEDILQDLQDAIITATRQYSIYDIGSQLDVYKRLEFSNYKMHAKLRALGYDDDVIGKLIEEISHD